MSLADELLADMEDGDDDYADSMMPGFNDISVPANALCSTSAAGGGPVGLNGDGEDGVGDEDGGDEDTPSPMEVDGVVASDPVTGEPRRGAPILIDNGQRSIRDIAKLHNSDQLRTIISVIDKYRDTERKDEVIGPIESDEEYKIIVDGNNITVEIDNEINIIHKFIRDLYNKRFPELESLVPLPLEYIHTVNILLNDIQKNCRQHNTGLLKYLTPATIMVVSVTASTTQGDELDAEDQLSIKTGCQMALDLCEYRENICTYVESRMAFIAPNLSVIVGASCAAKLMGIAGGLSGLAKMPACNILVLGAQKRTLSGFSSTAIAPHTGFIYYCPLVQKQPSDVRRRTARLVAAKCTLAARVDSFHKSYDGSAGMSFRADIEAKLDKILEPPPVKTIKPLPAPIDMGKKKRGGRRYRKMKERLGMTDIRKASNIMNFGEIECDAYQEDLGLSLGNLGKGRSGKIRAMPTDSKTKAKISKTLQNKLSKSDNSWGGTTTIKKQISGIASSVAFTPLQGLEIVNPNTVDKLKATNDKYFSSTSRFTRNANK